MKNIVKNFVEIEIADMEGRNYKWVTAKRTYEEEVKALDNWTRAVRVVEKTFDPETFKITEREIKRTEKVYEGWRWNGKTNEIVH